MNTKRNVVLFLASSLDGYIAAKDESLDWLYQVEGEGDNGFSEFYETIDAVLIGRKTYDWMMKQTNGEFPYQGKTCFVFTRKARQPEEHATFIHDGIASFVQQLNAKPGKNIWLVGGGDLLHAFLQQQLVDEIILTIAPVVLGRGIPLFHEKNSQISLSLKRIRTFNQFAELHYAVKNG